MRLKGRRKPNLAPRRLRAALRISVVKPLRGESNAAFVRRMRASKMYAAQNYTVSFNVQVKKPLGPSGERRLEMLVTGILDSPDWGLPSKYDATNITVRRA